jgi:hypothetical protein
VADLTPTPAELAAFDVALGLTLPPHVRRGEQYQAEALRSIRPEVFDYLLDQCMDALTEAQEARKDGAR